MIIVKKENKDFDNILQNFISSKPEYNQEINKNVANIIDNVREKGDKAILSYINKFDKADLKDGKDLVVTTQELEKAVLNTDKNVIEALTIAKTRIESYQKKIMPKDVYYKDDIGSKLGLRWQPIEKIGIYVPGGLFPYPSSVLMNVIPALVAGCKDIFVATPANGGKISDVILSACSLCGIPANRIYKIGGAVAIAAFAFGSETVQKVDKITGPGNTYVALAKKQVYGEVGIDLIAGPTDILIIADSNNDPSWIACDMLAQLEHGDDSTAVLITDSHDFATSVLSSISIIVADVYPNSNSELIINKSLIIVVGSLKDEAYDICNKIAPEHLQIVTAKHNKEIKDKIINAGAIFLGKYTGEALGDYILGPSHVLPTAGTSRFSSGLSVYDFLKRSSIMEVEKSSFMALQNSAQTIAEKENLLCHQLSIKVRDE